MSQYQGLFLRCIAARRKKNDWPKNNAVARANEVAGYKPKVGGCAEID